SAKASADNAEIQFFYDTEERLRSIVNESGKYYYYGYNKRGEVITETGFDGVHREYDRDVAGKVIKTTRPGEKHTLYEYDANGRIIRIEYHDGSWEHFRYDRNGQLIEAGNEHGIISFTRNKTGLIETEQQGSYFIKNKYDRHGNRIALQSSLGAMIELNRNEVGLVNSIYAQHNSLETSAANNIRESAWAAHYRYNRSGQEIHRQLPGDINSYKDYDHAGRPSSIKVNRGNTLQSWKKYTWETNDKLSEIVDAMSHAVSSFRHDALGNLVFAQYADGNMIHRETDELGNLYESRNKKDRTYNAAGALLETKTHRYKYDESGNMTSKTDRATQKKTLFEWYANGMLKKVVRPDGKSVSFKYDALGRRFEKIFNGIVTRFIWDGNVPLHEWSYPENERPQTIVDEWGQISVDKVEPVVNLTTWVFDADSFVPAARMHNGKTNSIIADYMGTPSMMFDENGQKVWEAALDIYGRVRTLEGERSSLPFRYQGQYEDVETGLYYNRFRYYAPEEGLYISQDPIGLLGNNPNIYAYTHDPNSWLDVLGLAHDLIGEIIRNGQTIHSQPYQSGGVFTGMGSPNQQQALLTHTERKFLNDAMDIVEPKDHLKMTGELNPCKPGCQPAVRDFVLANDVTAEYHATSTNRTYHWERVSDKHVIQTEMADGKVVGRYKYNMETRRRTRISCG
ncbi:MAG TPA: RHS repeat-associated core domain-containing protein, partial [Chitinophagaceae bacterium]|nr:RHS repeat-associated core domain-containing protein [Chitinophagaceae bacterium]